LVGGEPAAGAGTEARTGRLGSATRRPFSVFLPSPRDDRRPRCRPDPRL